MFKSVPNTNLTAHNSDMGQPIIISQDTALLGQMQAAAAAADIQIDICDTPAEVRRCWGAASLIVVGVDKAAMVAGLGLSTRSGVHIIGTDAQSVLAWSVPLDAPGLVLPQQSGFLAALLEDAHRPGGGAGHELQLFGASGGIGASTIAAGLAVRAAKRGKQVALVELCPYGGGIDFMMGAESDSGWRWGDLAAARGHIGELAMHLPTVLGVRVLAASRPNPSGLGPLAARASSAAIAPPDAISAVLASLRRTQDLIVIDQGRTPPTSDNTVLVVAADVRSVLAAQTMMATGAVTARHIVVRAGPGRRLPTHIVTDTLGLPVAGVIPHDARLPAAMEAGDPPGRARGRSSRAFDALLDALVPDWAR